MTMINILEPKFYTFRIRNNEYTIDINSVQSIAYINRLNDNMCITFKNGSYILIGSNKEEYNNFKNDFDNIVRKLYPIEV